MINVIPDPSTLPNPVKGFIFFSNYGKTDSAGADRTIESIVEDTMATFHIVSSDVWVQPFEPHGAEGWVHWASFIRECYQPDLDAYLDRLGAMLVEAQGRIEQ